MRDERMPLPVVDGLLLEEHHRKLLCPDELLMDRQGRQRRLPRFFYEVDSWQTALQLQLAENFTLWEFMGVDVREALPFRRFPRYVPCAVTLLATHLQLLRNELGTFVHIAANGGYRTPAHRLSDHASTHCWGTAVNIYKIGDDLLDTEEKLERYGRVAMRALPHAFIRPYGHEKGLADDHLHIDIGYVLQVPQAAASERACA